MFCPYLSPAMVAIYGDGEPDPVENPPVDQAPPVDPPKPTYEELETRLKDLEAIAERESAWTAREAELTASLADRDSRFAELKARHDKAAIQTAITAAAVEHNAFSVPQIMGLLAHRASVAEDGSVVIDVDGVQMGANDVLAKMSEDIATFGNLFRANVVKGIAGHSGAGVAPGSGGKVNLATISSSEYRRLRKENPAALGLDRPGVTR